jgi:EAL domain-containing protein (putative c-di-GMP-specific phosphodiesterase class I)
MDKSLPKYSFAFQPIVNVTTGIISSFEALVRGENDESAFHILQQISQENMYRFDAMLRERAISLAAKLGISCNLNLNLMPGSLVDSEEAMTTTINAANQHLIGLDKIVIEITETEFIKDHRGFVDKINKYRSQGIKLAIDDFGAGYSGLNLLAEFQPDDIKLDVSLVRDIDIRGPSQAIVRGIIRTCQDLGIEIIAEGVENPSEYWWLHNEGIELFQGYLLAKPGFEHLPIAHYPE